MSRRLLSVMCVLGLVCAVPAWADEWDIETEDFIDMAGSLFCNPCADPPEVLEVTDGTHHGVYKARAQYNQDGELMGYDVRIHFNHQGVKAVGYDLMTNDEGQIVDADGNVVERCRQAARVPDGPTTSYSIPGHYQFVANVNTKEADKWVMNEVFMCHMISHGEEENALVHYNGHVEIDASNNTLTFVMDKDHLWCKCAGPDKDGAANCDEWPDNCIDLLLY